MGFAAAGAAIEYPHRRTNIQLYTFRRLERDQFWQRMYMMLDRQVALELLLADKLGDAHRRRRFIQEAKAASALNHPNIVAIYEIVILDDYEVISMELASRKTLSQLISHGVRQSEVLRYAIAPGAAHHAGSQTMRPMMPPL